MNWRSFFRSEPGKPRVRLWRVMLLLAIVFLAAFGFFYIYMIGMPGKSFAGELPTLTPAQVELRNELERDLSHLCDTIGVRNLFETDGLKRAEDFLTTSLASAGYAVERHVYSVSGDDCANLVVVLPGTTHASEIVVVGGHYDTVDDCVGANDNGTGAIATLALARRFAGKQFSRTLRFVEFVNEEPPFFQTENMGSLQYARRCRARNENITAMVSLETMGYFSDAPGSQQYPPGIAAFYPSTGNFIGFVGSVGSRGLVTRALKVFREKAAFPSEGAALPSVLPGIGWSDHWAFWQVDYPAFMVTDTAPFRYPHYHSPNDTVDKIDMERFARVVSGLIPVIESLASAK